MTALRTLEPLKTISAPESLSHHLHLAGRSIGIVECAVCGKCVSESSVIDDPVAPWNHQFAVRRRMFCDHCNHIQFWMQLSASDGQLYPGPPLDGPGYLKKRDAIASFLRRYPHAAGIEQSAPRPV